MNFETFEDDEMNIISFLNGVASIKDDYVKDCKFMYMSLETLYYDLLEGGSEYV